MKLKALILAASVATLSGCAVTSSPVGNALYTDVSGPVGVSNSAEASKLGKSCAHNVLGLVATGDASIEAAKKSGNISTVSSVDGHGTSVLFLYSRFCTVVKGQ